MAQMGGVVMAQMGGRASYCFWEICTNKMVFRRVSFLVIETVLKLK